MDLLKSENHATKILKSDHQKVDTLFKKFEKAAGKQEKVELVTEICQELTVHAEVEERIFYPAASRALGEDGEDMLNEATVEHATLKGLIIRLNGMSPEDPLFKAYVTVLKEYVQHHVKEEEGEMFPKIEKTSLDLEALGKQMLSLKESLQAKLVSSGRKPSSSVRAPMLASGEDKSKPRRRAA